MKNLFEKIYNLFYPVVEVEDNGDKVYAPMVRFCYRGVDLLYPRRNSFSCQELEEIIDNFLTENDRFVGELELCPYGRDFALQIR